MSVQGFYYISCWHCFFVGAQPRRHVSRSVSLNAHQKLAVIVLRLVAALWTAFIVLGWSMYAVEAAVGVEVQHYPEHTIIGNMAYIAFGVLVLVFSMPLGRLLGRGLEE